MTWQEACKKSPHRMAIQRGDGGQFGRWAAVCTKGGHVMLMGLFWPKGKGFRDVGHTNGESWKLRDNWQPLEHPKAWAGKPGGLMADSDRPRDIIVTVKE